MYYNMLYYFKITVQLLFPYSNIIIDEYIPNLFKYDS